MREEAVVQLREAVQADENPLSVLIGFALDEALPVQTRMQACSIAMPYLFPRLSASTIDARVTNVSVDAAAVLEKITARLERIASEAKSVELIEGNSKGDEKDRVLNGLSRNPL